MERPLVRVMGQMALFIDPVASAHLRLAATGDVDTLVLAVTDGKTQRVNPTARQILASEKFESLGDRMEAAGGNLKYFLGE